ncbi:MAG: hypothetical protein RLY85_638 [Bacteroidota bacterium]|jgi:hypothetical protein
MVFPVKVPYTVAADITKYAGEVFNPSPDPQYLQQKGFELDRLGHDVAAFDQEGKRLVNQLATYTGKPYTHDIRELALQLEEDVAMLQDGVLRAICFCFPSGFVPAAKLGMGFFDMHLPVGDGKKLRESSDKVTMLISKEGACFRRYVWTITSLPGLSQHPDLVRPIPSWVDDLWFRTETQTTIGLADGVCLFFVKVNMYPLAAVFEDPIRKSAILNSLDSMSDAVLDYKNLWQIRELIQSNR